MRYNDKALCAKINELLTAISSGDGEGAAMLFDIAYSRLYAVAYRYCLERNLAEDLVAEVFANIGYIASHYRDGQNGFNFLSKIIKNKYLNTVRYSKLRNYSQLKEEIAATRDDIDEKIAQMDVKEGLKKLDSEEYEVVYCKFYLDMTFRAIAEHTGRSLGATQRIYARAMSALKKYL